MLTLGNYQEPPLNLTEPSRYLSSKRWCKAPQTSPQPSRTAGQVIRADPALLCQPMRCNGPCSTGQRTCEPAAVVEKVEVGDRASYYQKLPTSCSTASPTGRLPHLCCQCSVGAGPISADHLYGGLGAKCLAPGQLDLILVVKCLTSSRP